MVLGFALSGRYDRTMGRGPHLILGPGRRLARLAASLAEPVVRVEDLAELFSPGPLAGTTIVLDLAATPLEDLGLVTRLRDRHPEARWTWTGGPSDLASRGRCIAGGDALLPWPLDVTAPPFARSTGSVTAVRAAESMWPDASGAGRSGTAPAEPVDDGALRSSGRTSDGRPVRTSDSGPSGGSGGDGGTARVDPDLAEIEAILEGVDRARAERRRESAGPLAPYDHDEDLDDLFDEEELDALGFIVEDDLEEESSDAPRTAFQPQEGDPAVDPFSTDSDDGFDPDQLLAGQLAEGLGGALAPESGYTADRSTSSARSAIESSTCADPATGSVAVPRWYKDQVADLADLVQRTELSFERAAETADVDPARHELGRLRQFARTLALVASPPEAGPGAATLDLALLVEETLASITTGRVSTEDGGEDSPRFLYRGAAGVTIRADKGLLVAALDAVLQTAAAAASGEDVVRTEVVRTDASVAEVRVDSPAGLLAGLAPERILAPYGTKGRLEGVGANALAAAGAICLGHGGDLDVSRRADGRLLFALRLPTS